MARKTVNISEHDLQCTVNQYLELSLIEGESYYTAHESSIGLGVMKINNLKDSFVTKQCKTFYNRFIIAAQTKFVRKGVKPGGHDGYIFYQGGKVVCLEFKAKNGTVQNNQKHTHELFKKMGFPTEMPRKLEDIPVILEKYDIPHKKIEIM